MKRVKEGLLAGLVIGAASSISGCGILGLLLNKPVDFGKVPRNVFVFEEDAREEPFKIASYSYDKNPGRIKVYATALNGEGKPIDGDVPFDVLKTNDSNHNSKRTIWSVYVNDNDFDDFPNGEKYGVVIEPPANRIWLAGADEDWFYLGNIPIGRRGRNINVHYIKGPSNESLGEDVEELQDDVEVVEEDVNGIQDDIDNLYEDVGQLQDDVDEIQEVVGIVEDEEPSVRCYNAVDCDDSNANTIDTCFAAGTINSSCAYTTAPIPVIPTPTPPVPITPTPPAPPQPQLPPPPAPPQPPLLPPPPVIPEPTNNELFAQVYAEMERFENIHGEVFSPIVVNSGTPLDIYMKTYMPELLFQRIGAPTSVSVNEEYTGNNNCFRISEVGSLIDKGVDDGERVFSYRVRWERTPDCTQLWERSNGRANFNIDGEPRLVSDIDDVIPSP